MAPAFSKEAILRGDADYLCLVCENYFRSEHEIINHITQISHRENLKNTTFVEKYKSDRVKKIKRWYFCELCNALLPTITKIVLHVEESRHVENKSQFFERAGDFVVVSDNVGIQEDTWHGLIGCACTLCNVEFEDKEVHKIEITHVIHLIQSKIINANGNIYRKMIDSSFHCLTCNEVVAQITAHFDKSQHKELLQKCRDLKKIEKYASSNSQESRKDKINTYEYIGTKSDNEAAALSCSEPIKPVTEVTSPNIDKHAVYPEQQDDKCLNEKKCHGLDEKTYIIHDAHGKTLCVLCNRVINLSEIKTHLNDLHHQTALPSHNQHEEDLKHNDNIVNDTNKDSLHILNKIPHFQRNFININFESCTAVCKRCSIHLDFNSVAIENHIQEHKSDQQKKKSPKLSTPDNLEKDNNYKSDSKTFDNNSVDLKIHVGKNKEMLTTKSTLHAQETKTVPSKRGAKDKQKGNVNHKVTNNFSKSEKIMSSDDDFKKQRENKNDNGTSKNSKGNKVIKDTNTKKCNLQKVYSHFFISKMKMLLDGNEPFSYYILNDKFCINIFSFLLINVIGSERFRCPICEVNLHAENINSHINEEKHSRMILESFVVIYSSEFIREVRSESFHCGFCNIMVASWIEMENHLKSVSHEESKTAANWRLEQYLSEIQSNAPEHISDKEFLKHILQNL